MDGFWSFLAGLTAGFPTWFRGFLVVFLPALAILGPLIPSILQELRQWRQDRHEREVTRALVRRTIDRDGTEKLGPSDAKPNDGEELKP